MHLKHATRIYGGPPYHIPICACSEWGLPSHIVTDMLVRSYHTVSAFHHRGWRVFFSVALSVGSLRPAVSWHPALWSPDFPQMSYNTRSHLAHSLGVL